MSDKRKEIKITPDGNLGWEVHFDGRRTGHLSPDEALGLVAALIDTSSTLCWLKTPEQHKAWDEKYKKQTKS